MLGSGDLPRPKLVGNTSLLLVGATLVPDVCQCVKHNETHGNLTVVHGNVMPGKRTYIGGVGLLMASGSASSLVGKILYAVKGPDLGGHSKAFGKPWFAALLMFLGMSICLPCSWLYRLVFRLGDAPSQGGYGVLSHDESEQGQDAAHLRETESTWSLAEIAESTKAWWRRYDAVLFPTLFDLFASALLGIGLLFTTVVRISVGHVISILLNQF